MKKWPSLILLASLTFLVANCQKEKALPNAIGEDTEFIFGTAYGYCASNCVHLYKMIGGKIYPDLMDRGNPAEATFADTPLSEEDYRLALPVMEQFPNDLFSEETVIGCPDCADQGAYFIRVTKDGDVFQWTVDVNEQNLPTYLLPYARLIGEVVTKLRD